MEATTIDTLVSQRVEAEQLEGDLELSENVGGNNVLGMLACPKDVSSDCTIQAAMEEDYRVRMGFVDDYVCVICDDGGRLIRCEGDCGRWFHPTKPDGKHSRCRTLGLSEEQVEQLVFVCKNCEYKKHQCVFCGRLGCSDISADFKYVEFNEKRPAKLFKHKFSGQYSRRKQVLQCNKKGCKRFCHPECMERDYNKKTEDIECPMHECWSCKNEGTEVAGKHATPEVINERATQTEGREPSDMHLVQCRRCSKAYHRKCLPSDTSSRTWTITDDLILFYCLDHRMVKCLRSATRDHLRFPENNEVKKGTSPQGASKKRSVPEGQADHANKESDPVSENGDKIPKTHKGSPAPEQAETPCSAHFHQA